MVIDRAGPHSQGLSHQLSQEHTQPWAPGKKCVGKFQEMLPRPSKHCQLLHIHKGFSCMENFPYSCTEHAAATAWPSSVAANTSTTPAWLQHLHQCPHQQNRSLQSLSAALPWNRVWLGNLILSKKPRFGVVVNLAMALVLELVNATVSKSCCKGLQVWWGFDNKRG